MRGTKFWTAAVATVVLGATASGAQAWVPDTARDIARDTARDTAREVTLDGRPVAGDVTRTWTRVGVEVTPHLRAGLGLDRRAPDHVVADVWADDVTAGLSTAEKALLATGGHGGGLAVHIDARTGRYLSVGVPEDDARASALAISTTHVTHCSTAASRSCLDRGLFRLKVAVSGTGSSTAAFSSSQGFKVRSGGSATFTVVRSNGNLRQTWPAGASASWSAPGVTVSRISH